MINKEICLQSFAHVIVHIANNNNFDIHLISRLGVSKQTWNNWMNGKNISDENLQKLLHLMNDVHFCKKAGLYPIKKRKRYVREKL